VGKECKILGNFEVKGHCSLDEKSELYGTLKTTGNVVCGKNVKIYGSLLSDGVVTISDQVEIIGDVSGDSILLSKAASVRGKLLAKNGISFMDPSREQASEKVNRFDHDVDVVDEVKELLG
jgi:predicted acyltransferase (DUF342 family)